MTRQPLARRATGPFRCIARPFAVALALALCHAQPAHAQAFDPARADIDAFIATVGKKHGFEAEPLPYQYDGPARNGGTDPNRGLFPKLRKVWNRLPAPVARALGPKLVRYFP